MKFSIKDFFRKCDQIRWKLRIWSHLLKKSLMENSIVCAVWQVQNTKLPEGNYSSPRHLNPSASRMQLLGL